MDKHLESTDFESPAALCVGWAEVDITPTAQPVSIVGQFFARLSEGVADPLKATACALESKGEQVVFVSCDLVYISIELRDSVRATLSVVGAELDPMKVILSATHTHTGPNICSDSSAGLANKTVGGGMVGVDMGEAPSEEYIAFAAGRIAECIENAWNSRTTGGVAFGLGYAVVGHNRRWVNAEGASAMYGLCAPANEGFRHVEGAEDHSLNLVATYDDQDRLTGLIVNLPCPSQEDEALFVVSADFWHETRKELRQRFGDGLFILAQVSAAGELTSHPILNTAAHLRMLELKGVSPRQEIACRIGDAVEKVLPYIDKAIDRTPILAHRIEMMELPANRLTQADADDAKRAAETFRLQYESLRESLEADPIVAKEPRWYTEITGHYTGMIWHLSVVDRYERQKTQSTYTEEVHVLRLGEIAFATNPYEYYLDFGTQMKVRSPAIQTFLVQLCGQGTYVPSPRSVANGGYGSVAASNPVGVEGGQVLVDGTIRALRSLWNEEPRS